MKTPTALFVVSWLCFGFVLSFPDPFNNAFNFQFDLEPNIDSVSEFHSQGEVEGVDLELKLPGSTLFEQTPANGAAFAPYRFHALDGSNNDRAVSKRQLECPAGTELCPNERCCPVGSTCVTDGCCSEGKEQCGSGGCFNPETQICCGGIGETCPEGYECETKGCCREGTKPCGSGCYNPKTQVCCEDGTCPKGNDCVDGGCCPEGMKPCGTGKCYDPETQVCCASENRACPKGKDCVTGGCCPKGMKLCGKSKCYDPETQTCCPGGSDLCSRSGGACSLDTICPRDMTCIQDNRCCPEGQESCGENGCYNPETETCCEEDGGHCPKNYDCLKLKDGGGCCPKGMIKCGKTKCYDPLTQVCCQDETGANIWACKRGGGQCCVASKGCFDVSTERCCASGPCGIDAACCNGKCCADGELCDKNKKCRKRPKTRSSTTKSCKTPTPTKPQPSPPKTIQFVYDPARVIVPKNAPPPKPTMTVSNSAVLENMCRGIDQVNGGKGGQTATLTHGGRCWQKKNRKSMCPSGWCADAAKDFVDQFFPDGAPAWAEGAITAAADMECDEFPFASSLQGGNLAKGVRMCIPADDNGWQGTTMSSFFNKKKGGLDPDILPGHDYAVEIVGWDCDQQAPIRNTPRDLFVDRLGTTPIDWSGLAKRDAFDESIERTGGEMYHGYNSEDPSLNLVTMPLGDLVAGTYVVHLDVNKGKLSFTVVDNVGNTINATTLSNGNVQFTLDEDWDSVVLGGITDDKEIDLSYSAEADINPLTTEAATLTTALDTTATGHSTAEPTTDAGNLIEAMHGLKTIAMFCAVALVNL